MHIQGDDRIGPEGLIRYYARTPSNRMLVCQAIAHGMTPVTPDPMARRYPVRTLW